MKNSHVILLPHLHYQIILIKESLLRSKLDKFRQDTRKLEREIELKQQRAEKNFRDVSSNRRARFQNSRERQQQRSLSVIAMKERRRQLFAVKAAEAVKRAYEADERVADMKAERDKQRPVWNLNSEAKKREEEKESNSIKKQKSSKELKRGSMKFKLNVKKQTKRGWEYSKKLAEEVDRFERIKIMVLENPDIDPDDIIREYADQN